MKGKRRERGEGRRAKELSGHQKTAVPVTSFTVPIVVPAFFHTPHCPCWSLSFLYGYCVYKGLYVGHDSEELHWGWPS